MLRTWGEQDLANTIKEHSRKLLTIDTPIELVPTISMTISIDAVNGSSQQENPKSKKKGGKGKAKKAKGGPVKVAMRPEQANRTGYFQKSEFASLESIYTKWASEGKKKQPMHFTISSAVQALA